MQQEHQKQQRPQTNHQHPLLFLSLILLLMRVLIELFVLFLVTRQMPVNFVNDRQLDHNFFDYHHASKSESEKEADLQSPLQLLNRITMILREYENQDEEEKEG